MSGAGPRPRISAVVPTLGLSPHLERCLEALRDDGGDGMEIVVVLQGVGEDAESDGSGGAGAANVRARPAGAARRGRAPEGVSGPDLAALRARLRPRADRWIESARNLGFAGGTDLGIAACGGELVATVNDDAVVLPGWTSALADALDADPGTAAAQGANLRLGTEASGTPQVDGWGLAWNRWWQAVQLGHGGAPPPPGPPREVFGVSATAALYRRSALDAVADPDPFDRRLGSWYEDADLAVRLRAAGHKALSVPAARALHAGGATGSRHPLRYAALLRGNRWLVTARLLGRRFPLALPRLLGRDLLDAVRRPALAPGIAAGWGRAARRLPAWVHARPPALPAGELQRLAAERCEE